MLTLTGQRNLYGELTTGTSNVSNMDFGERIIQAETRRIVAKLGDHLLHTTSNGTAVINQQVYELPNKVKKLRGVTFMIGSDTRQVKRSPTREHWDSLNTGNATAYTSDFPDWYYIIGKKILYWPTPSSSSATITYDFDKIYTPATQADYTTGTIASITQGSTTVTGAATTWSSAFVDRFIQINKSDTHENDGDADFYEIATVNSTTELSLEKPYSGHSILGGAATYRIGEISPLPDGFHELPVYRAVEFYYSKTDQGRSQVFRQLANDLEAELLAANEASELVIVEEVDDIGIESPSLYPRDLR